MTSLHCLAAIGATALWIGIATGCSVGSQTVKDDPKKPTVAETDKSDGKTGGSGPDDPSLKPVTAVVEKPGNKPEPTTEAAKQGAYKPPRHPLIITRSGAPRTSLAVAAENRLDVGLEIGREADLSVKRYKNSGAATEETFQLKNALQLGTPKTTELVQFANGATLYRVDVFVKVGDAVPLQSLVSFLKRLERNAYLTVSEVAFKATRRWWGVCRSGSTLTVSAWYAKGTPSLPEVQVHLPKISATRVAYGLVSSMQAGELDKVTVGPRSFSVTGRATSADDIATYAAAVEGEHRCMGNVDVDDSAVAERSGAPAGVAFVLNGKLKCRTR